IDILVDEPIDSGAGATFTVSDGFTGNAIPGSTDLSADGRVLRFHPSSALPVGRRVYVSLRNVLDLAGNAALVNYGFGFQFTTEFVADTTAPTLLAAGPSDGAVNMPTNVRPVLAFSKPMSSLPLDAEVTLTGDQVIPINVETVRGTGIAITPYVPLDPY